MVPPNRKAVIENIQKAVLEKNFHAKVEIEDPVLGTKERSHILKKYIRVRKTPLFKIKNFVAGRLADLITWKVNRNTLIYGLENVEGITQSCIFTCNHFSPTENTVIRLLSQKMGRGNLYVVSQDSNLRMRGWVGFFLYYMDIIPVSKDKEYMTKQFEKLLSEAFERGQNVLIYPEEEMWFHYRKPRPPKRGAYYYAAKHHVPIVPCFIEIRQLADLETDEFWRVQYVLHIGKPIYPDLFASVRENSIQMAKKDYTAKREAYEAAYGKPLTYEFSEWDIAGWRRS